MRNLLISITEHRHYRRIIIFLFIILFSLRLHNLVADPPNWKRIGDIFDEGSWLVNAKDAIVFGQITLDDHNKWLTIPLNSFLWIMSFKIFGVGLFSARLVSAVSGCLTLVLIYWVMLKAYNRKMAILALLCLGLNETYLMYNRLILVESTIGLCVLSSFVLWHLGQQGKKYYFLCGVAVALAFLAKSYNLIYYSALAAIWLKEYWNFLKQRKIIEALKPVGLALAGFFLIVIPFFVFVFLPNYKFLKNEYAHLAFHTVHIAGIKGLLSLMALGFSQSLAEHLLTQLPASLLVVFLIALVIYVMSQPAFNLGKVISNLNPVIFYSLVFAVISWISCFPFGFIDRRQVVFLIPWSILASRAIYFLLFEDKNKIFNENYEKKRDSQLSVVLGIFAYSLWAFIHVLYRKYEIIDFPFKSKYLAFLALGGVILMVILILSQVGRSVLGQQKIMKYCPLLSFVLLAALPLSRSLKTMGEVVFGWGFMPHFPEYGDVIRVLLFLGLLFLCFALLNKDFTINSLFTAEAARFWISGYLVINCAMIFLSVFMAPRSIYEESRRLARLIPPGAIVEGTCAHQLGIEDKFYTFNRYQISKTQFKNLRTDAGYYMFPVPQEHVVEIDETEKNWYLKEGHQFLTTVKILPYLFSKDNYRVVLQVYAIPENRDKRVYPPSQKTTAF